MYCLISPLEIPIFRLVCMSRVTLGHVFEALLNFFVCFGGGCLVLVTVWG